MGDLKSAISTFFAGLLFGVGLTISQMVNPAKVIAFLDISGDWDPSLAIVMVSALAITFFGYRYILRTSKPLFSSEFRLPKRQDIDARLILGAVLFGIGWGLVGLCPGPAISGLTFAGLNVILFLSSMLITIVGFRVITRK